MNSLDTYTEFELAAMLCDYSMTIETLKTFKTTREPINLLLVRMNEIIEHLNTL
jgi:hypothetical protein